jgi:hypothetical protein
VYWLDDFANFGKRLLNLDFRNAIAVAIGSKIGCEFIPLGDCQQITF